MTNGKRISVAIIHKRNNHNIAFNLILDELLKITEVDIRNDIPGSGADIYYWLSIGAYSGFRDHNEARKGDLVLFNPQRDWRENIKKIDNCVFQCSYYYETVDIKRKFLAPCGYDSSIFKPNIKIGMVCVYQNDKGFTLLSELFKKQIWSNFTFYLCGPRWWHWVQENKWFVDLKYTPEIPNHELPKFYQNLDYFLITANPERGEGGPLTMIEALACGIPVISTNVGYAKELDIIKYTTLDELVGILKGIEKREKDKVKSYTWDNFRKKHIEIFKTLGNYVNGLK